MRTKILIPIIAALMVSTAASAIKVHTIGDSTMATYDESSTELRGWGQMLEQFFSGLTVNNRAKSGSSSKSFYNGSAYWPTVKNQMSEGDYVFIQFAHNDEKNGGCDGDSVIAYYNSIGDEESASATSSVGTTPFDTYKKYLRAYVNETRELGCTPILVAPICRRYFTSGKIRRNGRHDLGDSYSLLTDEGITTGNSVSTDDDTYDYPYQMSLVAEELDVPFIDLTSATAELYESYGDELSAELLFCSSDGTHTVALGATLVARLCVQLLEEEGILTDYINLTTSLTVSTDTLDMGSAYKGQTVVKEMQVNGFDLDPEEGTVKIEASDGLLISLDGETYSNSIEISYEGGNTITTIYVECTMSEAGQIEETITVNGGDVTIEVPVVGSCVVLEGGTSFSAYWRLESSDACESDGPINIVGETYSSMVLQRYSAPNANTTWPDWTGFETSRKTQRNLIEGETWPAGDIDEVEDRWVDFAVSAPEGTTLNVDSISFFVCGCGGNGMCCKVYYIVDDNLADEVMMASWTKMTANSMQFVSATPVLALAEGQTLHIRFYPWYNNEATGKTLCISDVTISGVAYDEDETTGIASFSNAFITGTTYYSLGGQRLPQPQTGINIIRETSQDGAVKVRKVAIN